VSGKAILAPTPDTRQLQPETILIDLSHGLRVSRAGYFDVTENLEKGV
jgi:hypothetical protein